jgi:CDP-diacylglycerol--glycerol-3-phosphate 3-phosphatidyltransferase
LAGPIVIAAALTNQSRLIFASLLVAAMLSDIFDGVLARRFGVARPWLRRFDSATDIVYYLCVFIATWFVARETIIKSVLPFCLLALSEIAVLLFSFLRFGAMPATHTYLAKAYGLIIFVAFFAVLTFGFGAWVFWLLTVIGLAANLEIFLILALSTRAPVDVLSIVDLKRKAI